MSSHSGHQHQIPEGDIACTLDTIAQSITTPDATLLDAVNGIAYEVRNLCDVQQAIALSITQLVELYANPRIAANVDDFATRSLDEPTRLDVAASAPKLLQLVRGQAALVLEEALSKVESATGRGILNRDPYIALAEVLEGAGYVLCSRADAQP